MVLAEIVGVSQSTINLMNYAGWVIILLLLFMVVVPYWRGKADLMTAWNFVLVGCALFIGVASLEAVDPPELLFEREVSFDFPQNYYTATLIRSIFFLACLFGIYYVLPMGKRFASRRFVNSPPWSPLVYGSILILCGGIGLISVVLAGTGAGFFQEAFLNLGQKAATFAIVFAFYAWYRDRLSLIALAILLAVLVLCAVYVMRISHGRRLLLCVAFAPIAVAYWTKWRYKSRTRVLLIGGAGAAFVLLIGLWYQTFRFYDRGKHAQERTFANTVQAAKQVDVDSMLEQVRDWKWRLSQGAFPYAMIVKRLVDSGQLDERPLNSIQFLLTYPIPRKYWDKKPYPLGASIVRDVLHLKYRTTWGLGVAGQAYYEGDWYALVVYAALIVLLVRLVDEPLKREPNNPFFIAVCASASLYLVAWPRGDLGVQTAEIVECFLFLVGLQFAGAFFTSARKDAYAFDFGSMLAARAAALSR